MKEKPILFSGLMVRAILEGRKTQTRRVLKGSTEFKGPYNPAYLEAHKDSRGWATICPYGLVGDRLWVRETWNYAQRDGYDAPNDGRPGVGDDQTIPHPIWYRATDEGQVEGPWRPSIFMPRWASRITLEITEIRVQRLQGITEEDAKAEGADLEPPTDGCIGKSYYRRGFMKLWNRINGKTCPWTSNPWVWAITFKRVGVQE